MKYKENGSELTINFEGHIDSANAKEIEDEISAIKAKAHPEKLVIDCENLQYISSAGLRIVLRLMKEIKPISIVNVSSEVYEIFDMTGFTEMAEVHKAYRKVSVDGCEIIGKGANGTVYRIDRDTIVKVYVNPDSLPEIQRERELARKAFVLGIPTAIPYDVVRVGEGYGSVFELLSAKSLAEILSKDPGQFDSVLKYSVDLLKTIHSKELPKGEMPDCKATVLGWVEFLKDYLPEAQYKKLKALVEAVPEDNHIMHGDYHMKNVMLQDGEALLIDMDTLCLGHPVFEFGSIFNSYIGYSELDTENVRKFLGIPFETAKQIWDRTVRMYFGTDDEAFIQAVKDKAKVVGYTRVMRRAIRRGSMDDPATLAVVNNCRKHFDELLARLDTLEF
ncbi:MAG: anti-sigma factor antagonist [Clostridia bacterium]|nr:anti-sigma factor antagonist [Clostridia bacterium]